MFSTTDKLIKPEIEKFADNDLVAIEKKERAYRVATYNILSCRLYDPTGKFFNAQTDYKFSWDFRKNLILESIRKLSIDILALQEVRPEQLAFISENLPEYGVIGYSEHCGKSLDAINTEKLTNDDIREIVPILYRKDKFRFINSKVGFLSDTPNEVSTAKGASRPRIVVAGAFECQFDNTIIIVSNTHYDHQNNSERLMKAGHLEVQFIEEFASSFNTYEIIYLGDRNSFVDKECDANQWYRQFKNESKAMDTREANVYYGAATTFIGYDNDKYKASFNPKTGSYEPVVLDTIFYKGKGTILKSLNSLIEYEFQKDKIEMGTKQSPKVSLCSFFTKPKNPSERQFASDHSCLMTDIAHA